MSTELLQSSKGSDDDMLNSLCLWQPAFTWLSHGAYVNALFFSHEAQNREDGETGQEAGGAVQEAQHEGVPGNKQGIWCNAPWFRTETIWFCKTRDGSGDWRRSGQSVCGKVRLWETWQWGIFFEVWLCRSVFSAHSCHSFWKPSDRWEKHLTSYISVRGWACVCVWVSLIAVIVVFVVTSQGCETSQADSIREKYLGTSIHPYLEREEEEEGING